MNIGIIGCGSISSQYMIGLNKNEKYLNVVACADQDFEKSKSFANDYKIQSLSVEDLLLNNEIDIVVNLTPPSSHFDISYKSL
ncbi:gfo/Idh/MocA family oxidoreductase, partial [archaeon]|nr:gfo/Idh/MocA family oxidoreductase [archaeon]